MGGGISDPFPDVLGRLLIIQSRNLCKDSQKHSHMIWLSPVEVLEGKIVSWSLPAQARASQSPMHPAFCEINVC